MLTKGLHSPAHLFVDNAAYFISSAIYQKRPLLASAIIKQHLIATIRDCLSEKNWLLNDWVILNNHYHLLAISRKGEDMPKIFRKIHVLSSGSFNLRWNATHPFGGITGIIAHVMKKII